MLISITFILNGEQKRGGRGGAHKAIFFLLNSRKIFMEIKVSCSPGGLGSAATETTAVDKRRLSPCYSLQSKEEENELTEKLTPCRKLPKGSTLEHIGLYTI